MSDASRHASPDPAADQRGEAACDRIGSALAYVRGGLPANGRTLKTPTLASQKARLEAWARDLGLLLNPADLPSKALKGGQEHELWHNEATDRYWKLTRGGIFGLQPGIELALVSSDQDARNFHLWEATPIEYLERLALHNLLAPGLNELEGIIVQEDDLSIVTSQPRFDLVPVTEAEIDAWFAALDFSKVTHSAYYRADDNLGVFDAHDKNLVRAGDTLIPFDIIPCRPSGGFLQFIHDTLAAGHHLTAVRTTHRRL